MSVRTSLFLKQLLVNPSLVLAGVKTPVNDALVELGQPGVCTGGGVPLGAVPALSWCGDVSLGGLLMIINSYKPGVRSCKDSCERRAVRAGAAGGARYIYIYIYINAVRDYARFFGTSSYKSSLISFLFAGVKTPVNDALVELVQQAERENLGLDRRHLSAATLLAAVGMAR